MLNLTRYEGDETRSSVLLKDRLTGREIGWVHLTEIKGNRAVLGFDFDQSIEIIRSEIVRQCGARTAPTGRRGTVGGAQQGQKRG